MGVRRKCIFSLVNLLRSVLLSAFSYCYLLSLLVFFFVVSRVFLMVRRFCRYITTIISFIRRSVFSNPIMSLALM